MGGSKKQESNAEQGIQQAGADLYARSKMTPQEEAQYQSSFQLGKLLEDISRYEQGLGPKPAGYLSPEEQYMLQSGELGRILQEQTLAEARAPEAFYESTLRPELQLAEDYINRGAAQRGLIRSGIPIEQMGRAGVELAIKSANARMDARRQALAQAGALSQYQRGISRESRGDLGSLYGQQQQLGGSAMQRQAQAATQAANYQAYPYQASLGDVYGRKAAMYALPGQAIGAAGQIASAFIPMGMSAMSAGAGRLAPSSGPTGGTGVNYSTITPSGMGNNFSMSNPVFTRAI